MKLILTLGAFALVAKALSGQNTICCFRLTTDSLVSGTADKLDDGQYRIGRRSLPTKYCINSRGAISDSTGRRCVMNPTTTQFQCDVKANSEPGFSIDVDGTLSYNGNPQFVACDSGKRGGLKFYITPPANDDKVACGDVTLRASSCSQPLSRRLSSCPTTLSGNFEFPHLIIPINSSAPTKAYGTSYNGEVTPTISTIFNFDIPQTDASKQCSLVFLFPKEDSLKTSSYTFSGNGHVNFALLKSPATASTTYNNAPPVASNYGNFTLLPGNSYSIATFPCPAGKAIGVEIKNSGNTTLNYFQDKGAPPIGLYITVC